jgi:Methyltransferase domain
MCRSASACITSYRSVPGACARSTTSWPARSIATAVGRGAALEDATGGVVVYRAPCDAAATGLPAASVDVVFSNSVLEHVPRPAIERCLVEARRTLRAGGVMFHSVNCGDHYAYVDRDVHQLNYLRFSDVQWRKWNNRFLYQNRLRAVDFVEMARAAGFAIEVDTSRPHPVRLRQLERSASIRSSRATAASSWRSPASTSSVGSGSGRSPGRGCGPHRPVGRGAPEGVWIEEPGRERTHVAGASAGWRSWSSLTRGASPPGPPYCLARGAPTPRSALQAHSLPLVRCL